MGAQERRACSKNFRSAHFFFTPDFNAMLPPMKSTMKTGAKAMTKGQITKKLAEASGLKQGASSKLLNSFVDIAAKEVKKNGVFSIAGLCRLKTRVKPATKAGVKTFFGKEVTVKAKPATTVVMHTVQRL